MVKAETTPKAALDEAVASITERLPEDYPREVISYSCLKEIKVCPMRWKLKYIDKIRPPRSPAQIVGLAIHKGIEEFYVGAVDPQEAAVAKYMEEVPELTPKDRIGKDLSVVQRVLRAYIEAYKDETHTAVELRTTASVGSSVRLEAVTDLLTDGCIVDHKTSRGAHFVPDPHQLVMNALTLHVNGYEFERGEIRQLRKDVTGKLDKYPIVNVHEFEFTPEFITEGAQEIVNRLDEISARLRLEAWSGPPLPKEEAARMCTYACQIPTVFPCPARA